VIRKLAVSFAGVVVVLAAAGTVRADSLPALPGNSGGPNGFWSYGTYQSGVDPADSMAFDLSGGPGEMTIGTWTNSGMVFNDLTWQPEKLTLTPGYGPIIVTWTALSAGTYTVTSTILPDADLSNSSGGNGPSLSSPLGQGSGSGSQSGPFSANFDFNAGDSIGFLATNGQTDNSGLSIEFGPAGVDAVPEPSRGVALMGLGLMAVFGALWIRHPGKGAITKLLSGSRPTLRKAQSIGEHPKSLGSMIDSESFSGSLTV
jgi:hypothetical protein